jgi:acyl dehydratase
MQGGVEIFHYRPVCAGEKLHGELVVQNVIEKEGKRSGKMTLIEIDAKLYDENEKLVILARNTFIERA